MTVLTVAEDIAWGIGAVILAAAGALSRLSGGRLARRRWENSMARLLRRIGEGDR